MDADTTFSIAFGANKKALHWAPSRITWGEILEWMQSPANHKDTTGYVLGELRETTRTHPKSKVPCTDYHRIKTGILARSALTLDVDTPGPGFLDQMELTFPYDAVMHTTFSSAPDEPRYRLIIPTDREMAPDEYIAAADALMDMFGREQFDTGSNEPERFMYKPSAQEPSWFQHWVLEGELARVDDLLTSFTKDLSTRPLPAPPRSKRDPYALEGTIGAFNRAYEDDWDALIREYELPYEKVDEERYQLAGSQSEAGMGPVQGTSGLVYSHHANDPAFGQTCSAFDLVRLHLYGELDAAMPKGTPVASLPSQKAMQELATQDVRVIRELVGEDFAEEMDDAVQTDGWKSGLRFSGATGELKDTIQNWDLIRENDWFFQGLRYDDLDMSVVTVADKLPWRSVEGMGGRTLTNADRWEAVYYIERIYRYRPTRALLDSFIDIQATRNRYHPVKDYLESLVWDGVERLETALPGVRPTPFTRQVARKSLVAAVARVFEPGYKWDHVLVLYGSEGLGKSWWINRMSRGWTSTLGRIDNKDTLLAMRRSWIMVSDEGYSLRKGDADAMKEFITRTVDVFRMPYERETMAHPRTSVVWSTTNDETFLRRQEGNRRFLIVHSEDRVDFERLTDDYIDQVWAEAVRYYQQGELLFFDEEQSKLATAERERFVEEDSMAGQIQEYLDTLVPEDFWDRSPEGRREWLTSHADGFEKDGEWTIDRVCSRQVWKEALGQRSEPNRSELLEITNALKRLPGWTVVHGRQRIPGYGPQMVFVRDDLL